jgi:hypothetical protein
MSWNAAHRSLLARPAINLRLDASVKALIGVIAANEHRSAQEVLERWVLDGLAHYAKDLEGKSNVKNQRRAKSAS